MEGSRKRRRVRTATASRGRRRSAATRVVRVDPDAQTLWRDGIEVQLRPRTWAVLRHLIERPDVLITKEDLLEAIWGDVRVTEATLSQSISELRAALDDDAKKPRFIVTVHRRGFRFLGGVHVASRPDADPFASSVRGDARARVLVGREDELARLRLAFSAAGRGTRQMVFVSGEPGIGKTTLVAAFLDSLTSDVAVGLGGGVNELGDVEPFFPVLEAVRKLAKGPQRAVVGEALREHAPRWLQQLAGIGAAPPDGRTGEEPAPASRMLLRLARAIEMVARRTPLVLVLEDLHWADQGTIDLLALLARATEPCRLLVVATYRLSEAVLRGDRLDRLRAEMSRDSRVSHLPLPGLSTDACDSYLRGRFGGSEPPHGLVDMLHAHSDGNPLFLTTAVDHLLHRGWLQQGDDRLTLSCPLATADAALPADLMTLVEHETRELSPAEARVLEAASVAGGEFSVQEVAAALDADVEDVEACLEGLASSWRFVRCVGAETWPDDTVGSRWRFLHALHRRALLARVSAARLQRWHQRIGERIESGWGARREEVVTALATHFEASRDPARALEYLDAAARVAERRSAPADAKDFLSRALHRLIVRGSRHADRHRELELRIRIVTAINAMEGYASEELREQLRQAIELCDDRGHERFRFRLTFALAASCMGVNDPRVKDHLRALSNQANALASPDAHLLCETLGGVVAILEGRFPDAAQLDQLVDAPHDVDEDLYVGSNFAVLVPVWAALRRCAIGDVDGSRRLSEEALVRSQKQSNRLNEAFALYGAAQIAAWDRDRDRLEALALRSELLTREYGYRYWGGFVRFFLRRLQALQDPRPGSFDALKNLVDELGIYSSSRRAAVAVGLAEVALRERRLVDGLAAVDAGLAAIESGFARLGHSELLRMRAALRRAAGEAPQRVREDLEAALAIARQQGAAAYAERVTADLAGVT